MLKHADKNETGFTLIELMIVVAIIGILASVAIPQFMSYRIKAFNSAAERDLRNAKLAEEALYTDYMSYGTSVGGTTLAAATGAAGAGAVIDGGAALAPGNINVVATSTAGQAIKIEVSNQVQLLVSTDANEVSYIIAAKHRLGDRCFANDSDATAIYWVANPTWVGSAAGAIPATVPNSTSGNNDIAATGGGGSPVANWTVL